MCRCMCRSREATQESEIQSEWEKKVLGQTACQETLCVDGKGCGGIQVTLEILEKKVTEV